MTASSYIGIERKDGTVDAIFVRYDGEPRRRRDDLRRGGYTTYEAVDALIRGGDLSDVASGMKWVSEFVVRSAVTFHSAGGYVGNLRHKKLIEYLYLFRWESKTWEYMVANACDYDDSLRKFQGWESLGVEENVKTIRISIAELLEQSFEIDVPVNAMKEEIFQIARDQYDRCALVVDCENVVERDVTILENEYIENNGDFPMEKF